MRSAPLKVAALVFLGAFLIQLAWVAATPPFRGMDEFDHAYRAISLAHGYWTPSADAAPAGERGDLVRVPASLVRAATPICDSYRYIDMRGCLPLRRFSDGTVTVVSGAAWYNPVVYLPLGLAGRLASGTASLYVMRIVSAATCSALIALAAWSVLQWSRTIWPLVGVLVAVTPVAVYSGSTPAPNGPEMFAGLALWSALVGLRRVAPTDLAARRLLVAAIVPTALLAAARTLGPVWLLLIAATILPLVGPHKLWVLVRAWPRTTALTVGVGLTATAGALAWTLMVGAQRIVGGYDRGLPDPFTSSLKLVPWWLLQSIAAFPDKVDPAPGPVYGSAGLLLSLVLLLGLRQGTLLLRLMTLGTVVVSLTVPTVLSAATYSALGPIWQGRYGLPYAMGIALVASIALDERPPPKRVPAALALSAWSILLFIEHLAGALHVLQIELVDSPLSGSTSWLLPNPWLLVVLVLAASVSWASAIRVWRPAPGSCVVGCARTNALPRAIPESDVRQVTA